MKVADIMTTDVSTCAAGDTLTRAAQLMWERRCGCLPVLDEGGAVVGVLTDRDVCMAAYTQGRRLDEIPVTTAMSRPAHACFAAATLEEVEDSMMAHAVRRLVVVDGAGHVQGLVSLDDIARAAAAWDADGDIDAERVALALGEISRRITTPDEDEPQAPEAEATEDVRGNLAALKTLRDELRVDLNLAGKEARDRWRRFETRLRAAETRAKEARRGGGARSLAGLVASAKQLRRRVGKKKEKAKATRRRAR